jgi:peptidoglycan/LPS O-acetylase OafA/YrhL
MAGLMQEFGSVIIVWFVGALMMLAISSETFRSKLSGRLAARVVSGLFVLALASAVFGAYVAFAWTGQYYDVFLGLQLSAFVFLGVLLLNGNETGRASKWILHKRLVGLVTAGAGFSYTLFLTHYPIIIFLNGLNLPIDRFLMFLLMVLITNFTAFSIAHFTEKRHRDLAKTIKTRFGLQQ